MNKKERKGYKWMPTSVGGYWSKMSGNAHKHKLDFFCAHCQRPTGSIDDDYLLKYGICSVCYVMHVENKETPTIDLSKYKKNK